MFACALVYLVVSQSSARANGDDGTVRTIEARSDNDGSPEIEPLVSEPEVASAPASRGSLLVGVRAGVTAPLSFLRPGYLAGIEGHYRLPLLDQRLRLSAFFGRTESSAVGPRLVPGRGYDPAFIQNSLSYPLEALMHIELLSQATQAVTLGAGYAVSFASASFEALGATERRSAVGHSALLQLGYRRKLGPGEAALMVQGAAGAVRLGGLGSVGTESLSAVHVSLSWAVAVLP